MVALKRFQKIADYLNNKIAIQTPRGSKWTRGAVKRVIDTVGEEGSLR